MMINITNSVGDAPILGDKIEDHKSTERGLIGLIRVSLQTVTNINTSVRSGGLGI